MGLNNNYMQGRNKTTITMLLKTLVATLASTMISLARKAWIVQSWTLIERILEVARGWDSLTKEAKGLVVQ